VTDLSLTFAVFRRHKMRTLFTVLSVTVAFAIFLVLATLYHGFAGLINYGQAQRLNVWGESFAKLPLSYAARIAPLPGVKAVAYQTGLYGHFRDPRNGVYVTGATFTQYMKVFPELSVTAAGRRAMLADRQCAIAGAPTARKMGWKVGDTIPISGAPAQTNGSTTWYFHLCGIFKSTLPDSLVPSLVAHYAYLNEGRADAKARDQVDQIFVMADDARDVSHVVRAIDKMFANTQPAVMVLPDSLLSISVVKSFGDVGAILTYIGIAVFFSMLLVTGNAMSNSVRERMNEFALMRALGFGRARLAWLVLKESAWIIGLGAGLGLLLGWRLCLGMAPVIGDILPYFVVTWQAVAVAFLLAVLFAALTGILPARRVTTLPVADTLRRT